MKVKSAVRVDLASGSCLITLNIQTSSIMQLVSVFLFYAEPELVRW